MPALEKRCVKYLWNLINNNCKLYNNIAKLSLNNVSTTIGENMMLSSENYVNRETHVVI